MQIFNVNITRVVWPRVMNILDFRYFCQHNPLFYHLNLIPCHCWSWQRNIYFLVNTFVRHTFPMSKSSILESSELLAFKRQKDGYKVTVNVYLCIYVVPSWDGLEKGHSGNKPNLSARNNGYQHGEKPFSPVPGFVSYHKSFSELLFVTLHGFQGIRGTHALGTL